MLIWSSRRRAVRGSTLQHWRSLMPFSLISIRSWVWFPLLKQFCALQQYHRVCLSDVAPLYQCPRLAIMIPLMAMPMVGKCAPWYAHSSVSTLTNPYEISVHSVGYYQYLHIGKFQKYGKNVQQFKHAICFKYRYFFQFIFLAMVCSLKYI